MSVDIGERIRSLRTARGLSQEEVARRTGIGLKSYGDLERGRTKDPHYSTLRGVARALNVRVEELLEEPVPLAEVPQETRLPDLAQRREYAQRLMDAGVSEATAREVSGEFSRSEEYWRALAKYAGLEASEAAPTQAAPAPAEALETSPAAAHDEVVATFPYSPETQAAVFEGALRAAADARSEYDAVLSGEYRLVVRDDGECVEIVLEPLTIDPASQYESLRKRV